MEGWMINIAIALFGIAGTYAVLRARVSRLESDRIKDKEDYEKEKDDFIKRLNAGFKRIDTVSDKVIILERDSKNLLDLDTAEKKFVTRVEMKLHLEKIEIVTENTSKEVSRIMEKQSNILDLLHKMSKEK